MDRNLRVVLVHDDRWLRLLVALALAVGFVGVIWVWTRGALLYGADNIGIYQAGNFLTSPHSDYLIPSLMAGLFPTNPTAALYLGTGVDAFLSAYAAQFLARQLLRRTFFGVRLLAVGAIAAGLYMVSPVAISYWYVGLLTNVALSTSAYFGVLGLLVKLLKSFSAGRLFPLRDAVALGILFGLSGPNSIPNEVRLIGISLVLLAGAAVLGLGAFRRSRAEARATYGSLARVAALSAPLAAALLFYPLYEFVTSPGFNLHSVGQVASFYSGRFSGTTYNTLAATLRLEGRVSFQHTLYYPAYAASPALQLASFAWPALALVVPTIAVLLWDFPDRALVAALELIAIPSVFWEAGSNPPAGPLHDALVSILPYGNTLLQTYSLTLILLSKLFPVLVAFSVVLLGSFLGRLIAPRARAVGAPAAPFDILSPPFDGSGYRPSGRSRIVAAVASVALVVLVAASAMPIFNGQVERTTWAPDQEGYRIPPAYYEVRSALLAHTVPHVLLLPEIGTYVKTAWGFNGANGFYSNFYYPAQVIVPRFYGQYALFVNSTIQNYSIATNPLQPQWSTTTSLGVAWPPELSHATATSAGGLRYGFGASHVLALGNLTWLRAVIPYVNASYVEGAIAAGNLWVGVQTALGGVSWYILGSASNALVESMAGGNLTVDLLLDAPNVGPPLTGAKVSGLAAQIRQPAYTFGILGTPVGLYSVNGSTISAVWDGTMHGLGVSYLLVDSTITGGQAEPGTLLNDTLAQLTSQGYLFPAFSAGGLTLYRLGTA